MNPVSSNTLNLSSANIYSTRTSIKNFVVLSHNYMCWNTSIFLNKKKWTYFVTLQVNFFNDHTKIILSYMRNDYFVTYIDEERCASTYSMVHLIQDGCSKDIMDRMSFSKFMLKNLVNIEGADIWLDKQKNLTFDWMISRYTFYPIGYWCSYYKLARKKIRKNKIIESICFSQQRSSIFFSPVFTPLPKDRTLDLPKLKDIKTKGRKLREKRKNKMLGTSIFSFSTMLSKGLLNTGRVLKYGDSVVKCERRFPYFSAYTSHFDICSVTICSIVNKMFK